MDSNEGEGLSETIVEADYVVRIPMARGVDSLNVAAGGCCELSGSSCSTILRLAFQSYL